LWGYPSWRTLHALSCYRMIVKTAESQIKYI
jgi:hypothetical protein